MTADDLYGLALDSFIAQRTALARELRADGRRDEAAAVAALRKPTVAAWAVNQLVRTQRPAIDTLFAAGDEARETQQQVLEGRSDGAALRDAVAGERAAVDVLVQRASGLLDAGGHPPSPAVLERVADTLHAAALDEEARDEVRDGRLERELRHVGLSAGVVSTPAPRRDGARRPNAPNAAAEAEAEAQARRRAEAELSAAEERAQAAEDALQAAAQERDRAAAELRRVEQALTRASTELREAEEALKQASAEAQAAVNALQSARRRLNR